VADFKDQCNRVRIELDQAYKLKIDKKVSKFKSEFIAIKENEMK
jgi:hypothetical protein